MDSKTHLVCETIQYITIQAYPAIYGEDNPHDLDSRDLLITFREWGEKFENWWLAHDEDWREEHDYILEVERYTDRMVKKYLDNLAQ